MTTNQLTKRNLTAIMNAHCADSIAMLARHLYKYTDCGAWLGVLVRDKWLYDTELRTLQKQPVSALKLGSIVEGSDQDCEVHVLDLATFDTPEAAVKAYGEAVEAIEEEATQIWNQGHGCDACAKHWQEEIGISELDEIPVWSECPACGGHGVPH